MKQAGRCSLLFAVAACFWGGAPVVRAAEQVVQNDSVVDFSEAVIIGNFAPGEEAGVRLTSPCDGDIVAVQILWLEGTAGHPQSLEQAIHIYADNAGFPVPGTALELLEGPVMTPGGFNEFRYTDEQQSIPLAVPVASGQNFYVTLEFANATDVGGGGPSVVHDLDACQAQRNIIYDNSSGYVDLCLVTYGNFAIRAVVDCVEPTGACCDFNAVCVNGVQQGDCTSAGDTFFLGQDCGQVTCPTPKGACCNGTGGCLANQTQSFCEGSLNGVYGGNGTTCADGVCALGACCLPDGACDDVIALSCAPLGGTFQGAGSTCASVSCAQPLGACCVDTTCVADQLAVDCASFNGTWQGAFSTCTPDPCVACNNGDADGDGDVDLQDFERLQGCFGATVLPGCDCLDMDGDGDVDLVDLAAFAAALDAGSGPQ